MRATRRTLSSFRVERQHWSDSPLVRSHPLADTKPGGQGATEARWLAAACEEPTSKVLLFSHGKCAVRGTRPRQRLAWYPWRSVPEGLKFRELLEEPPPPDFGAGSTLLLLGKDTREGGGGWRFAVDCSALEEDALAAALAGGYDDDGPVSMASPRSLMGTLSHDRAELAILGQAASRLNWHSEVLHCRRSGNPTVPVGAGHRRIDPTNMNHRTNTSYPRTDPVAIMLVQSPDGSKCLLGRTAKRANSNMFTCLAGFVEQCESVEDAVRREVFEEAGVTIGAGRQDVALIGSQPWPIGAAGHSELMLGCIATASSESIVVNRDEMDSVRWFSRDEALELLERSRSADPYGDANKALTCPPDFAIAHHLIQTWAEGGDNDDSEQPTLAGEILALKDLHDQGVLDSDEFKSAKAAVLDRYRAQGPS